MVFIKHIVLIEETTRPNKGKRKIKEKEKYKEKQVFVTASADTVRKTKTHCNIPNNKLTQKIQQ